MILIPLTPEGVELLKSARRHAVAQAMESLTLAQIDALHKAVNDSDLAFWGLRHAVARGLARQGVIEARGWGLQLTSLGYELAYQFGFMGSYNAYADELSLFGRSDPASK